MSNDLDIFTIMQDDTAPDLKVTLTDGAGSAIPVTGLTVTFKLYSENSRLLASGAATPVDAVNGIVKYVWQSGDTSTSGKHRGIFVIDHISPTAQQTVPNSYENRLTVQVDPRPGA